QRLNVLPKDLELLFGQDGTLYARTATQQLFSLTPIPPQPLLPLEQSQLQTNTVYSADTLRTANNLRVSKEMHLLFKAEQAIAFGPGFSVEKGAWLRCQTGF